MREIKLRVWDVSDERMYYNVTNISDINGYIMQWTGLLDKNGREIYEGDIVRGKYGKNGIVKNYEIRWLIGHFAAVDRNNITGDEHYYPIGLLEGEVIGNIFQDGDLLCDSQSPDRNRIYENPELLEESE